MFETLIKIKQRKDSNGQIVGYEQWFRIEGTNVLKLKFVPRPSLKSGGR